MKFRIRLLVQFALILCASLALQTFVMMTLMQHELIQWQQTSAVAIAKTIATLVNRGEIDLTHTTLLDHSDTALYWIDNVGVVIRSPQSQHHGEKIDLAQRLSARSDDGLWFATPWHSVLVAQNVIDHGKAAGYIAVESDHRALLGWSRRVQWAQIWYGIFNALLAIIFTYWLVDHLLLKPLKKLSQSVDRFQEGDFISHIDESHHTLTELGLKISQMVNRLRDSKQQLLTQNEKLDVAETHLLRAEQLAVVGQLSAGLVHEIGNPLAVVMGYLKLLPETPNHEQKDLLERTTSELERINGLVHELLEIARPTPLHFEPLSLKSVLLDACESLQHQPRGKEVHCHLSFENDFMVSADRERLRQIFLNLFLNSADAMQGNGHLYVNAQSLDPFHLQVIVSDTGPGFSKEALEHAMEPFFSTKPKHQGSGLGLTIVQTLALKQRGKLVIGNHPQGGALVILTLRQANPL